MVNSKVATLATPFNKKLNKNTVNDIQKNYKVLNSNIQVCPPF